jgi:hypothetical protein
MNGQEEIARQITAEEVGRALSFLIADRRSSTARQIATLLRIQGKFDQALDILRINDDCRRSVLQILEGRPKSEEEIRSFKEEIRSFREALVGLLWGEKILETHWVTYSSPGAFYRSRWMIQEREKLDELSERLTLFYRGEWFSQENFPATVDAILVYLNAFFWHYNQEDEWGDIANSGDRVSTSGDRVSTEVAEQGTEKFEPSVEVEDMITLDYVTFMLDTYAVYLDGFDITQLREQKSNTTWQRVREIISVMKRIYNCHIRMTPFSLAPHFTTTFTDLFKKFDLLWFK